jgi:FkbM family methyltransferase
VPSDEEIYVDVGAFDGETVFDFINSTPTGKYKAIHAFEPNPDFFPVLKEKSQYIPNLYCYPLAASNTQGSISFFKQKSGSRPIENTQEYKNDQIIEVKTCKLDDVIEKATLMKVEVEGHEVSVIEGASSIIKKNKPNLTVETYHFANDALKVFDSVMSIHKYKYIGWRMTGFFTNTIFFSDTQKLS